MALSPLAVTCVVAGAATAVRQTELSSGVLDFEARLGAAACVTMAVFLGGSPTAPRDRETCSTPEPSTLPGPRS